ncbi:MAG: hypothetical protein IPG63_07585 [Xanthomonadales bacterium]|nr:hypothetical protein [Xanthomonadales bacterium]
MRASNLGSGRKGVDETLGFFAEVDASILAEMAEIAELHLPGFSGCRIGGRTTILRDLESGQFLVTCGVGEADVRHFLDSPIHGLFCERSAWLYSWVEARYRDRLARFACKTGPALIAFQDSPERAAIWIAARLSESEVAKQASARVAASLAIPSHALTLAQRVRQAEGSPSAAIRFGDVSVLLRAGMVLERLSIEHPKWLAFVTVRMRAGLLSTQFDAMAQMKRLAHSAGASHAAWARLATEGPQPLGALNESKHEVRSNTETLDQELTRIVDGAKARHWLGRTWHNLHPDMQAAIATIVSAYAGCMDIVEPVLRALDAEATRRSALFDGLTEIENEFRELMICLLSYVVVCHDRGRRILLPRRVQVPSRHRWPDWVRWGHRFRIRRAFPFWIPLSTYAAGDFIAEALSTRADIEHEGQRMSNCIAGYVDRCSAGHYVLYRISDRGGSTVASYGATIDVSMTTDGRREATGVIMDEVSGHATSPVDHAVAVFAEQLTEQIRRRLPCEVVEPGW